MLFGCSGQCCPIGRRRTCKTRGRRSMRTQISAQYGLCLNSRLVSKRNTFLGTPFQKAQFFRAQLLQDPRLQGHPEVHVAVPQQSVKCIKKTSTSWTVASHSGWTFAAANIEAPTCLLVSIHETHLKYSNDGPNALIAQDYANLHYGGPCVASGQRPVADCG